VIEERKRKIQLKDPLSSKTSLFFNYVKPNTKYENNDVV
jgi:hypothetical protein